MRILRRWPEGIPQEFRVHPSPMSAVTNFARVCHSISIAGVLASRKAHAIHMLLDGIFSIWKSGCQESGSRIYEMFMMPMHQRQHACSAHSTETWHSHPIEGVESIDVQHGLLSCRWTVIGTSTSKDAVRVKMSKEVLSNGLRQVACSAWLSQTLSKPK